MTNVTAIADNTGSSGPSARVSGRTGRGDHQPFRNPALEAGSHEGNRAKPCTAREAADRILVSGLFEQIAADMIRLDREIVANAKPRPDFWETFAAYAAKTNMPVIAMRGWGL